MMKSIKFIAIASTAAFLAGCGTTHSGGSGNAKIYDESADGSKQISKALTQAKNEKKHLLVQFGANWSEGCHKLHDLFTTNVAIAQDIKKDYVWLLIDLDQAHNSEIDQQYGNVTKLGYPALVVLDADGRQLARIGGDDLEEAGQHSPEKALFFLQQWGPNRP